MSETRLGLSLEKDGSYSKLMVFLSALLSGMTFGIPVFHGVLTAQWKTEYGFDQSTASIHQRYFQGFLYFGSMILSAFYEKLGPRTWLAISTGVGTVAYALLYSAYYMPIEYFVYCQYVFGILGGLGSGLSFGLICITPQHWLDKTRSQMNPYLFIGAPIFAAILASLGAYVFEAALLTWPEAFMCLTALFLHQWIIVTMFIEHPSWKPENQNEKQTIKEGLSSTLSNYKKTLAFGGTFAFLFNCAVCSGFILSGVFTEIVNVAMESGITQAKAATLILYSSIPEALFFRPMWGLIASKFEKYADASTLQILWCTIFLASQLTLSFATVYWHFVVGMMLFSCGTSGYSGLKYVIHIDLVGGDLLQYILTFDTALAAICTIIVPTVSNYFAEKLDHSRFIFYVTSIASFICILVSFYVRAKVQEKKKENAALEEEKKALKSDNREDEAEMKSDELEK